MERIKDCKMTPNDKNQLNNVEIAVYALYLKGGVSRRVHTRDVINPGTAYWLLRLRASDVEKLACCPEISRNASKRGNYN